MSVAVPRSAVTLAALNARLRVVVQAAVAEGRDPADPTAGLYVSGDQVLEAAELAGAEASDERLAAAAAALGLGTLETAVLGLCAAPELDHRYERVFAFLHDDVTRKLPSPRVIADVLAGDELPREAVLACFDARAPLRRLGCLTLLDPDGMRPFADRAIRVADPLVSQLLGVAVGGAGHERLRPFDPPQLDPGRPRVIERLRSVLARPGRLPVLVAGPDALSLVARAAGPLLLADVRRLGDTPLLAYARLRGRFEGRLLVVDGLDDLEPDAHPAFRGALAAQPERVVLCARSPEAAVMCGDVAVVVLEVPEPALTERRAAWLQLARDAPVDEVAATFRLSMAQIAEAVEVAGIEAELAGRSHLLGADLAAGARSASSSRLGELATRLPPSYTWDDLVLPETQLRQVRSVSSYLRHREQVLSEWGYDQRVARTQGLKVLFAGESGTGKTMAAQVLGNALGLDLFRVDLATVVSKYIGETEKNLDRIFDAAEGSNAILFFDEADALFGKRSDVSDAHDRYANIETAYLLQKMEGHAGAVILATNFKQNMDDAFVRRLDVSVDFPFPEAEDRRAIWRLVLPEQAPVAPDVDLDFLAERFKLSGGQIRNCSLAAAFAAAEDRTAIGMTHLVRAVAEEYAKHGRLTLETDFQQFHGLLRR